MSTGTILYPSGTIPILSADWANPGAIGSNAKNTGAFTFVTGSRASAGLVAGGTTLTRTAHIGKSIEVNGGTINFPIDGDWQTYDEVETIVTGTNTTTFNGNGANIYYSDGGPLTSIQLSGLASVVVFRKMAPNLIYAFTGAGTLNALQGVVISAAKKNDVLKNDGTNWVNMPGQLSINDPVKRLMIWPGSGTIINVFGVGQVTAGTISHPTQAGTSYYNRVSRYIITSAATAGQIALVRCSNNKLWRGNASGLGGFEVKIEFGLAVLAAGNRGFVGITSLSANQTNIDPLTSTADHKIGVAYAANTGNWTLIYNNAGTAPTQVALGANFPIDVTSWYELVISCLPNDTQFVYNVTNKTTGQTTGNVAITGTNIPPNTIYMSPYVWMTNNATAAAVAPAVGMITAEYNY